MDEASTESAVRESPGATRLRAFFKYAVIAVCALLILGAICYYLVVSGWILAVLFAIIWFACFTLYEVDKSGWRRSRFATSLLTAWVVDALLFRIAVGTAPTTYRHFVPGIIVTSIFAGYIAWELLEASTRTYITRLDDLSSFEPPHDEERKVAGTPASGFGSFLLAVFLAVNIVAPTMSHYFPAYWHRVTYIDWQSIDNDPDPGY